MDWITLKDQIEKECKATHRSSYYTQSLIDNASLLFSKGLPLVFSAEHLSLLIGIDYQYLCSMAYSTKKFYRCFTIKKKNGKNRYIYEPLPDLKTVQRWILDNVLENIPVSRYAKAYVKGVNLKHNARFHLRQDKVLSMDIKDFFPSITIKDVVLIFEEMGYLHNLACFMAHLCCLNNRLPQGAPTSPYISNIRLANLDNRISDYTIKNNIRYTRYADDLSFSGSFDQHVLIPIISKYVWEEGFRVNSKKTRVARKNTRQEITGIVVNSHMQISRNQRRQIRQAIYYIKKFGLESHVEHINERRGHYLNHLLGIVNFALFINPKDSEMKGYFDYLTELKRQFGMH